MSTEANGNSEVLLRVEHLKNYFAVRQGVLSRVAAYVKAVDDISFEIGVGETLGLVGGKRLRQNHRGPLRAPPDQTHRGNSVFSRKESDPPACS